MRSGSVLLRRFGLAVVVCALVAGIQATPQSRPTLQVRPSPAALAGVPLEYFGTAIDWLKQQP